MVKGCIRESEGNLDEVFAKDLIEAAVTQLRVVAVVNDFVNDLVGFNRVVGGAIRPILIGKILRDIIDMLRDAILQDFLILLAIGERHAIFILEEPGRNLAMPQHDVTKNAPVVGVRPVNERVGMGVYRNEVSVGVIPSFWLHVVFC